METLTVNLRRNQAVLIIVALVICGCAGKALHDSISWQNHLLSVWQSPASSPQQRAAAVNKWVPPGTDGQMLMDLLGKGRGWGHYHGPVIDTNGKSYGDRETWSLEYPVTNGMIFLSFHTAPGGGFHVAFYRAAFFKYHRRPWEN